MEKKIMGIKLLGYVFAGFVVVVLVWMGISVMTERNVKEPAYALVRSGDGYEVRNYAPYLVAEVELPPNTENPLGAGFRILFDYIRGENKARRKISMTAPVLKESGAGKKIPMTKPVLRQVGEITTRVAFVLPAELSLETAPEPKNPRIHIRKIPARKMAVLRFGGYANDRLMAENRERLTSLLIRDGLRFDGDFLEAYYNPPWTPPFMRRNEVMIEID